MTGTEKSDCLKPLTLSRGRTLEQMDQVFHSHTAVHDWEMKAQITRLAIGQSAERRSGPGYEDKASKEEFIESK